ncbi:hypothetical protein, partial [Paraburkholderia graminis]|uniref:hypothetical protein n=1 Tax=Paraburkholderia graminis TaxID=60548 RepID=UPI0038BBC967
RIELIGHNLPFDARGIPPSERLHESERGRLLFRSPELRSIASGRAVIEGAAGTCQGYKQRGSRPDHVVLNCSFSHLIYLSADTIDGLTACCIVISVTPVRAFNDGLVRQMSSPPDASTDLSAACTGCISTWFTRRFFCYVNSINCANARDRWPSPLRQVAIGTKRAVLVSLTVEARITFKQIRREVCV